MTLPSPTLVSRLAVALVAVAIALVVAACPPDPRDEEAPHAVAMVGEEPVSRRDFLAELAWGGVARTADPASRAQLARAILDRMIEDLLLLQGAREQGIEVDDASVHREARRAAESYPVGTFARVLHSEQLTTAAFEDRIRRRLVIDAYVQGALVDKLTVEEDQVRALYERKIATSPQPEQVLARQVLVKTEEEANHILGEVRARRLSLADAARSFSEGPESGTGGEIGWFARGELPPVFDGCFDLKPGDVSDVVASQYGFHIFEVIAKRPAGVESFASASERLRIQLRREREEAATAALLDGLRARVDVRVDDEAISQALTLLPEAPEPEKAGPDPAPTGDWSTFPSGPPTLQGEVHELPGAEPESASPPAATDDDPPGAAGAPSDAPPPAPPAAVPAPPSANPAPADAPAPQNAEPQNAEPQNAEPQNAAPKPVAPSKPTASSPKASSEPNKASRASKAPAKAPAGAEAPVSKPVPKSKPGSAPKAESTPKAKPKPADPAGTPPAKPGDGNAPASGAP